MKKRTLIAIALLTLLTTISFPNWQPVTKFNLKIINIENNYLLKENEIKKSLLPLYDKNLFFLRNKEIENALKKNDFIESFEVKKKYPDKIYIKVFEKKPIAILLKEKKKFYLSDKIEIIEFKKYSHLNNLPYVIGDKDNFKKLFNELKKINFPFGIIKRYTLYESSRWDLVTVNKKLIRLPAKNYISGLKNYMLLIEKKNTQKYEVFDYRIKDQLILK